MTEEEKRLHRCCFAGHRPEKLKSDALAVRGWMNDQIYDALAAGYRTFITGMAMGVDLWAADQILTKRKLYENVHLIAVAPWPGFSARWSDEWKALYNKVWEQADHRVMLSDHYYAEVFRDRNQWMINHSNMMIVWHNGMTGGTADMITYAKEKGLAVVLKEE